MFKTVMAKTTLIAIACSISLSAHAIADSRTALDVPAGELIAALKTLATQSDVQLMYQPDQLRNIHTDGVKGTYSPQQAIAILLKGTALEARTDASGAVVIVPTASIASPSAAAETTRRESKSFWERLHLAQAESDNTVARDATANGAQRVELEEVVVNIPEVLVKGSKSLNTDIPRSRDDAQPYVVFDRTVIERSGATNVEDFLKQRLPMNAQTLTFNQDTNTIGSPSQINLRGLGTSSTLILIDGHRAISAIGQLAAPIQPDLNNIPMAAVERIEVLPTTASGIYGGSAVGGVVNVILRRDYSGIETKLNYENTFASDAAIRRIDFGSGFNFEGGKTNIMLSGSYSDQNPLLTRERDFVARGIRTLLANNGNDPQVLNFFGIIPPLGATTNIASLDGSPLFGPGTPNFTSVPKGYLGGGGLAPFQARAGVYNTDLPDTAQIGAGTGGKYSLLSYPTNKALMMTVRREFTPWLRAYVDLAGSDNTSRVQHSNLLSFGYFVSAAAPNNPFGKDILVTPPLASGDGELTVKNKARQAVGGVIVSLPRQWQAAADYTWQRDTWSMTDAPFLGGSGDDFFAIFDGTIDVLRDAPVDLSAYLEDSPNSPRRSTLKNPALRLSGPVGMLPGGAPTLSALLEHRDETFGTATTLFRGTLFFYPDRSQKVSSAYLEAKIPFFSERNARPFLKSLELQLAERWDRYTVNGATANVILNPDGTPSSPIQRQINHTRSNDPTVALRYQPVEDVILRASYGTGFLPPAMNQLLLDPVNPTSGRSELDPRRCTSAGSGCQPIGTIQLTSGGNPGLDPEQSESRSAGLVFEPHQMPGLRLSVDWSDIKKTNAITALSVQGMVDNESLFPGRITRAALTPADQALGYTGGRITAIDITSINAAEAEVESYDFAVDYGWKTGHWGDLNFYAIGTRLMHSTQQLLPTAPEKEGAGNGDGSLKWKANAGVSWGYGRMTLAWSARYFDSYPISGPDATNFNQLVRNQGGLFIPSQIYHDFFASYRFGEPGLKWANGVLSNLEAQLGVHNVFNKEPPINMNNTTFYISSFGDPRLASYYLTLKAAF